MQVKIDTRPLPIVILARWWRFPVFALVNFALYYFYHQPPPEGLSVAGFRALTVFLACVFLWMTQLLPLPVTGLFALIAPSLLGVIPLKEAFSFFGADAVFFILGVFILAAALYKSGLSTRMALHLLKRGSKSPRRLVFQVMLTAALLSFIMSEHAVAAMMFPLVVIISKRLSGTPEGAGYSRVLFLAMAWGCVIGGIATMLGGARVPLAVNFLQDMAGQTITFTQWSMGMFPIVITLFSFCYLLLTRYYPIRILTVMEADTVLDQQLRDCGRPLLEERFLALLLACTILGWIFWGGTTAIMAAISILSVILLFMFRVVKWRQIQENVEWGVILMYGGAIALSQILTSTQAGNWFAETHIVPYLSSPWALVIILSLMTMALTEALSNAAVVAIVVPIGLSIANTVGLDPKVVVYAVASASSMNYVLPMSTPAVAIAYSSGYLKIREVIVPASIMWVVSWGTLMLTAKFWWPVLGVKIGP
ncbi:MAG TPA: DASS family sodium-coupled anion symporter [Terriglobia bacterium]|nr:DASS family sodium-coupled anion symporter [Terriglobia bacterium]